MFNDAKNNKVTRIYLRVDDYVDILGMKSGLAKTSRQKTFENSIRTFIKTARDYGINVQALGGDTTWSEPIHRNYPNRYFDSVANYNKSNPDYKFTGIQFDVESYNSKNYQTNRTQVLTEYLDFVYSMSLKKNGNPIVSNSNFELGFAVPFWFDNQNQNGVNINWKSRGNKPVGFHVIDILSEINGGYIAIMDYRNYASGIDGSIDNAQDEFKYIAKNNRNVGVVIGQETTNVQPTKITFYGKNKATLSTEITKIINAFYKFSTFKGIAIHDLPGFIDL